MQALFGNWLNALNAKINNINNDRCPEKQVRFLCGSATVMRCMRSVGSPALSRKYGSTRMDEYRDDTFFLYGNVFIFAQNQKEEQAYPVSRPAPQTVWQTSISGESTWAL